MKESNRGPQGPLSNPSPAEIRAVRLAAKLTQTEAGMLVHTTCRTWQQWEAGDRHMHLAFWHLFRILTKRGDIKIQNTATDYAGRLAGQ